MRKCLQTCEIDTGLLSKKVVFTLLEFMKMFVQLYNLPVKMSDSEAQINNIVHIYWRTPWNMFWGPGSVLILWSWMMTLELLDFLMKMFYNVFSLNWYQKPLKSSWIPKLLCIQCVEYRLFNFVTKVSSPPQNQDWLFFEILIKS